ncbi:MAG: hypothetical protein ACXVC3_09900 [Bdellovibrio sp.]
MNFQSLSTVQRLKPSVPPSKKSEALIGQLQIEKETEVQSPPFKSSEDQKKWSTLIEIIHSKNDNDPRLDKSFHNLSTEFHLELFHYYSKLPMESRNDRGLVAFLIARDIQGPQDIDFLRSIYDEKPCLSLKDCSTTADNDSHLSNLDQVSSNYPQMVVLYQLDQQLKSGNPAFAMPPIKDHIKEILNRASQFPVPLVQRKAEAIKAAYPQFSS